MDKRYGILIVSVTILVLCFAGTASATNWNVNCSGGDADFTGIQDAITAASAGDTIIVSDGNYTENVRVYKRLTIQSESGPDATIVQAAASEDPVFNVTAAYVEICGFTAKGADTGIYLCDADYCNISNNNCSNNGGGISLQDSNSNSISNNTCTSNNGDGIYLGGSNKNSISNNDCSNNDGFHSSGIYLGGSNNNNISNNNCTNSGKGGIYLVSSNNNSKVFVFRGDGIILSYSSKNSISNNNCTNNGECGISFYESNNNSILNNNCDRISLFCLNYNLIYLNNFLKNTDNVFFYDSTNAWNSAEKITYTYNERTYTNYLGNYWTDYKEKYPDAEEIDSTGIWDTPYIIDGDEDNYPLMEPWENYIDTSQGSTKILFSDDFSNDGSGWVTYEGYHGRVIYKDGCLCVKDYTNPKATIYGESQRYFTDFVLEVETRLVGGTIDNWHIVCCRFKDEDNAYTFDISADGYYAIKKEVNDKVEVLAGPTYSAYIHQGQDVTNLIHVECIGSSLSLSVNGHLLRKVTDATFTGGDIALGANSLAGTFTEVAFDNLTVTKP